MVAHTNSAYLVFVAVGDDGKPIPVPRLIPETADQKHWYADAEKSAGASGSPNASRPTR